MYLTPALHAVLTCDLVTDSIMALFLSFSICETGIVTTLPSPLAQPGVESYAATKA